MCRYRIHRQVKMTTPLKIHVGATFQQIEELALHLEAQKPTILGFDTETTLWCDRVSLLQLSTNEECYHFQIGAAHDEFLRLPPVLFRILGNPEIVKVGVGLDHDADFLRKSLNITLRSGLDIQAIARTMGEVALSLCDLGYKYIPNFPGKDPLGHKGNWDGPLSPLQEYYSSRDAYYSLLIYQIMVLKQVPKKEENCLIQPDIFPGEDLELYKHWIQAYLKLAKYPLSFDCLVNYTINSYGPWRKKYLTNERRDKAHNALTYLSTILPFDVEKRKFLLLVN